MLLALCSFVIVDSCPVAHAYSSARAAYAPRVAHSLEKLFVAVVHAPSAYAARSVHSACACTAPVRWQLGGSAPCSFGSPML